MSDLGKYNRLMEILPYQDIVIERGMIYHGFEKL